MKLVLVGYIALIVVMFFATIKDFGCYAHTPKQIYEINNCNMFGAFFLWIFELVSNPLYFVAVFLWWIFHVGRKERV